MANIIAGLKGVVYTRVGGTVHVLRAGDVVPEGAKVGGHLVEYSVEDDFDPVAPKGDSNQQGEKSPEGDTSQGVEYPGDDATRDELNAYAAAVGLNPDDFKNKADLVAAIHQL